MRVLLKLSGELLLGNQQFGINVEACTQLAQNLKQMQVSDVEIGVVIGGGNIFRGFNLTGLGMQPTPADQIGMLATVMNGIAIQQALNETGCPSRVLSAIECPRAVETYTWRRAQQLLVQGEIVIFVGGTGNPYFTTDTAAALRACELQADILLKATKVDGIFDKDPSKDPTASKYSTLSYSQYLTENLQVMDATSVAMCRKGKIPIFVFNMQKLGQFSVKDILSQENLGTILMGE